MTRPTLQVGGDILDPDPFLRTAACGARQDKHIRLNGIECSRLHSANTSLLVCGDAERALRLVPDGRVQTAVTSPPYWSLRDYGVDSQTGRDDSLEAYVESVVSAFAEVRRILRDDGTAWLNVGDS